MEEILTLKLVLLFISMAIILVWITDYVEHLSPYKEAVIVSKEHKDGGSYKFFVQYDNGHRTRTKFIKVSKNVFDSYKTNDKIIIR